jgi:undecaprenyl phosphate N,N'-diacetylbacillosamine 1-phosphate transferase
MKPYRIVKRILDFILAIVLLVVLSPLLLIIAIAIKLESKGPIIFKQDRLGLDGKVFKMYKFRTMVDGAINMGTGLRTGEGDPRITGVGKFLRKTSLDELPQLLNVLCGEMSFVGPRPPVPYHPHRYEEYSEEQKRRFTVRPGITGYAQVMVRNSVPWDERISLDAMYVENMAITLDVRIIFQTLVSVIKKENIYLSPKAKKATSDCIVPDDTAKRTPMF